MATTEEKKKKSNSPFARRLSELIEEKPRGEADKLAGYLGVKKGVVSSYKYGVQPDFVVLVKIAQYFNVSLDWLLGVSAHNCRTSDTDAAGAAKYTGLSDKSVIALHRMSHGTEKYYAPDLDGIDFLDMALETSLETDLLEDKHHELLKKLAPAVSSDRIAYETIFHKFFELIFPSAQPDAMYLLKDPDKSDDPGEYAKAEVIKQYMAEREIHRFMDLLREKFNPDYAYRLHTDQATEDELKRVNAEISKTLMKNKASDDDTPEPQQAAADNEEE